MLQILDWQSVQNNADDDKDRDDNDARLKPIPETQKSIIVCLMQKKQYLFKK